MARVDCGVDGCEIKHRTFTGADACKVAHSRAECKCPSYAVERGWEHSWFRYGCELDPKKPSRSSQEPRRRTGTASAAADTPETGEDE